MSFSRLACWSVDGRSAILIKSFSRTDHSPHTLPYPVRPSHVGAALVRICSLSHMVWLDFNIFYLGRRILVHPVFLSKIYI